MSERRLWHRLDSEVIGEFGELPQICCCETAHSDSVAPSTEQNIESGC